MNFKSFLNFTLSSYALLFTNEPLPASRKEPQTPPGVRVVSLNSTQRVRQALSSECPSFGWTVKKVTAGSTSQTDLYEIGLYDREISRQESSDFIHYLKNFSITITAAKKDIPRIGPRPSKQETIGNKTTISYEDGLRLPTRIQITLAGSVLWVNSPVYIATIGKNEQNKIRNATVEQKTIAQQTPACDNPPRSIEKSRRNRDQDQIALIVMASIVPGSLAMVALFLGFNQVREDIRRDEEEERQTARNFTNFHRRDERALLSLVAGTPTSDGTDTYHPNDGVDLVNQIGPRILAAMRRR